MSIKWQNQAQKGLDVIKNGDRETIQEPQPEKAKGTNGNSHAHSTVSPGLVLSIYVWTP